MKMSDVFTKDEMNFKGWFGIAVENHNQPCFKAAKHAVQCHDELVQALTLALDITDMDEALKYMIKMALRKAKG